VTTKEKVEKIFQAIERADISMVDVQRLTSISRETLYKWKDGGNIKDFLRLGIMLKFAALIDAACDAGMLPLQNSLKVGARVALIRKIIANAATKKVE